mmetsp:Transcript_93335/g.285620  ORF Transcript_93335/g.285620 Transcript_93335/m.285620 type:complete len:213 (+) Transcript_93335:339-977(+)
MGQQERPGVQGGAVEDDQGGVQGDARAHSLACQGLQEHLQAAQGAGCAKGADASQAGPSPEAAAVVRQPGQVAPLQGRHRRDLQPGPLRQLLGLRGFGPAGQSLVHRGRQLQWARSLAVPGLRGVVRHEVRRVCRRLGVLRVRVRQDSPRHPDGVVQPVFRARQGHGALPEEPEVAPVPDAVHRRLREGPGQGRLQANGREPLQACPASEIA